MKNGLEVITYIYTHIHTYSQWGPGVTQMAKGWLERPLTTCVLIFKEYLNATWQILGQLQQVLR